MVAARPGPSTPRRQARRRPSGPARRLPPRRRSRSRRRSRRPRRSTGQADAEEGRRALTGTSPAVRLATWNVNSLQVRQPRVEAWLAEVQPDVVCLQETKLADGSFPALAFEALGYETAHHGQGQWNGVASCHAWASTTWSAGFADGDPPDPGRPPAVRPRAAASGSSSVYVPNGRALDHEHYQYKLAWLARLRAPPRRRT